MEGPLGAARGRRAAARWVRQSELRNKSTRRRPARLPLRGPELTPATRAPPARPPAHPGHTTGRTPASHSRGSLLGPTRVSRQMHDGTPGGSVGGPRGVAGGPMGARGRQVGRGGRVSERHHKHATRELVVDVTRLRLRSRRRRPSLAVCRARTAAAGCDPPQNNFSFFLDLPLEPIRFEPGLHLITEKPKQTLEAETGNGNRKQEMETGSRKRKQEVGNGNRWCACAPTAAVLHDNAPWTPWLKWDEVCAKLERLQGRATIARIHLQLLARAPLS